MARSALTAPSLSLSSAQALPPLSRIALGLARKLLTWETRRHGRRALTRLDPHLLRDIGLGPEAALAEAGKPFWRA